MGPEKLQQNISHPQIAALIKAMFDADQEMRERNLVSEDMYWDDELDARNTVAMKEIIAQIGFPTISKVGKERCDEACLLIRHADHDVAFQEHCLHLMKALFDGEITKSEIAYLDDRIKVNQGKKQIYGTQFRQIDKKHIPLPIEDEEHVDERRAEMGMNTLAERIQEMYEKYPLE